MNVNVSAALRAKLSSLTPAYPIAWEGINFEPGSNTFLSPFLLPAETFTPSFGDQFQRLEGIFQVNVNTPAGSGSGEAEGIADAIISHFWRGATVESGGVTVIIQKSWRSPAMSDGVWFRIPVNIRYWANVEIIPPN